MKKTLKIGMVFKVVHIDANDVRNCWIIKRQDSDGNFWAKQNVDGAGESEIRVKETDIHSFIPFIYSGRVFDTFSEAKDALVNEVTVVRGLEIVSVDDRFGIYRCSEGFNHVIKMPIL